MRSGSWITVGYGVEMVLRLGPSLILTRLLSPAAFGIMATAQVFLYTAVMLSDVGIRSLVITYERSDDPTFLRSVWTFQIVRGLVLAFVVALFGQLLGLAQAEGFLGPDNSFSEPMLPAMIAVLGVTLALDGLRSTNEHILARDLRQDRLVKLETGTKIAGAFVTVLAVWFTRSVWGFIYAALIVAVLRSGLSLLIIPGAKMGFCWDKTHIGYMISRGKWIGVSSWTTLTNSLADKILIGAFFGSQTLGLYTLAFSLADALHSLMDRTVRAVALPAIWNLLDRGQEAFDRGYRMLRGSVQAVSSVLGFTLTFAGPMLVSHLYDHRYQMAGSFLMLLAMKYLIFHLWLNRFVMEAKGKFRLLAGFNMIGTMLLWAAGYLLAQENELKIFISVIAFHNLVERMLSSAYLVRHGGLNIRDEVLSYSFAIMLIVGLLALWI